jgi:hypothetical protein
LIEGNFRSTAAAVHGVHAEVAAAGQRISVRLTWTGEMASAASAAYDTQDGNAAAGLENLNFGFAEV